MTPGPIYNNVSPPGPDGRLDVARLVPWGRGVEVLTRPMCGGCHSLVVRLAWLGIRFRRLSIDTEDGLAAWAYYGAPPVSPAAAIDGQLIDGGGDPDQLFHAVLDYVLRDLADYYFLRRGQE